MADPLVPKKHCSRCGQPLEPPVGEPGSHMRAGAELWICPERHEAWSWSPRMSKWLREPDPHPLSSAVKTAGNGFDAESRPCSECGRRMVYVERRDYGLPTDVPRLIHRVLTWSCKCGYEQEVARTLEP
jgi:hypothetical protein